MKRSARSQNGPLAGIRVLDFTTLLPGPLATLILREAGAIVIKIEPPTGDPLRHNEPTIGGVSISFAMLNRGKKCLTLDLKNPAHLAKAEKLAREADILVEQFRPGVMAKFGLGFENLAEINPGLIYCSITGYGQTGSAALRAGHDLNYLARSGILSLSGDEDSNPVMPPAQIADIGGGALPAAMNILLAIQQRHRTGRGAYLDISMSENVVGWMHGPLARAAVAIPEAGPGRGRLFGGSPRYHIYRTADGRHLAVAALEEKFWRAFCALIELDHSRIDQLGEGDDLSAEIAGIVGTRTAQAWMDKFEGHDVCVEIIRRADEVLNDEHFLSRKLFREKIELPDGRSMSALPVPLAASMRAVVSKSSASDDIGW